MLVCCGGLPSRCYRYHHRRPNGRSHVGWRCLRPRLPLTGFWRRAYTTSAPAFLLTSRQVCPPRNYNTRHVCTYVCMYVCMYVFYRALRGLAVIRLQSRFTCTLFSLRVEEKGGCGFGHILYLTSLIDLADCRLFCFPGKWWRWRPGPGAAHGQRDDGRR